MEDAVDNWEDLLNDDAAFDKIVQLKDDEDFEDEEIELDQVEQQAYTGQTGPAKPSEKKLEQKERKRRMQEKLETTKKKYEENAFGNIMLPQDKRNLKLQQILLSKKQDEMNIASLIGQEEEEKLEIPKIEFSLNNKENVQKFINVLAEKQKENNIDIALQQGMIIRGIEESLKQLAWSSKETGKMFEKIKTQLAIKERKERSNKKDKKKQVHVNLSKAASKKLALDEEDSSEEEAPQYEVVDSEEEEKKQEIGGEEEGNKIKEQIMNLKLENQLQAQGFIIRMIEIMKLIPDEKSRKDWSLEILIHLSENTCEQTPSKEWKEKVMEKVKEIHNGKMNEEKGATAKNKNPLLVRVNAGKATENEIVKAEQVEQEEQQEFDPDEDFM